MTNKMVRVAKKKDMNINLNGFFTLCIIFLCVATCDDCSGCRNNAKDLYCPAPQETRAASFKPAP